MLTALTVMGLALLKRWPQPHRDLAAAGVLGLLVFLFVSPFCALGSALFSARVVHHVILATVLGPLLVMAFDLHRRRPIGLVPATVIHGAIFWAWHIPALYSAALSSDLIFWAMQVTIVMSAALFWAAILRAEATAAVAALLATMVAMGVLGALITFAGRPLYPPHWLTTDAWGLSPLEDQQLAGLVMWAPAAAIYLLAALAILYRSLQARPAR